MKRVLPNLLLRVGFVAVLTLCWILLPDGEVVSSSANPALDPDERFVLESGQAAGRLSFEILEDKTGVHLPGRLFFAHKEPRDQVPIVGRFENFLVTASGREVKTVPVGQYDVYMAAQQFFCNFRVGCGTGSSSLGSRVQKAVAREPLAVNLSKATSRSIKMRGRSSLHYSQRAIQRPHLLLQEKRPCQKPSEPRSRAAPYREPSLI